MTHEEVKNSEGGGEGYRHIRGGECEPATPVELP